MLGHLGLSTNRLIRISYGPFQLGELPAGEVREIRGKVMRDQLGEKLTSAAETDFEAPIRPIVSAPPTVRKETRQGARPQTKKRPTGEGGRARRRR